jgi:hypothetical protein
MEKDKFTKLLAFVAGDPAAERDHYKQKYLQELAKKQAVEQLLVDLYDAQTNIATYVEALRGES